LGAEFAQSSRGGRGWKWGEVRGLSALLLQEMEQWAFLLPHIYARDLGITRGFGDFGGGARLLKDAEAVHGNVEEDA